ncbi:hypothetical protein EYF80_059002 [Liparis tanakae]|uniref:Uncharacterized protein n=1 Tax=Liparis tanakae TaxID=230148 RepID=A0A4Z2EPG3_9TELE|nr:hypothetical protein EYF80_059002 [Liparis tanakae]
MTAETFCRSMEPRALSRALVTWPMFLVTWRRERAPCHPEAGPPRGAAGRRGPYRLHGDGRLDLGGHGVDPGRHAQPVDAFVLLPDGVLRVHSGAFHVFLLQSLKVRRRSSTSSFLAFAIVFIVFIVETRRLLLRVLVFSAWGGLPDDVPDDAPDWTEGNVSSGFNVTPVKI